MSGFCGPFCTTGFSGSFCCVGSARCPFSVSGATGKESSALPLGTFAKVYLPLLVVASLLSGYAVYTYQPFLDHSKAEIDMDSYYNITYNESVFSNAIHVDARPNLSTGCFLRYSGIFLHNISGEPQTISFKQIRGIRFNRQL